MSYPERGASYRNKPAWMDRAVASEKRAEGGPLIDSRGRTLENPENEFVTNEPPARLVQAGSHHAAQDARDQAARRVRNSRAMPDRIMVGGEPDRKTGGRVRRRADGGGTKYPNKIPGLTDEQIDANEARRPPNYDASTQMSKPDDTLGTGDHMMDEPKMRDIDPKFTVKPKMDTGDRMEGKRIGRGIGQTLGWKRGGSVC